jgi:hypothetical protein
MFGWKPESDEPTMRRSRPASRRLDWPARRRTRRTRRASRPAPTLSADGPWNNARGHHSFWLRAPISTAWSGPYEGGDGESIMCRALRSGSGARHHTGAGAAVLHIAGLACSPGGGEGADRETKREHPGRGAGCGVSAGGVRVGQPGNRDSGSDVVSGRPGALAHSLPFVNDFDGHPDSRRGIGLRSPRLAAPRKLVHCRGSMGSR